MGLSWKNVELEADVTYSYTIMRKLLGLIEVAPKWKWLPDKKVVEIPMKPPHYLLLKKRKNKVYVYLARIKRGLIGPKVEKDVVALLQFQNQTFADMFMDWYTKHYPEFWDGFLKGYEEELKKFLELAGKGVSFQIF